jgi:hypothetical protein
VFTTIDEVNCEVQSDVDENPFGSDEEEEENILDPLERDQLCDKDSDANAMVEDSRVYLQYIPESYASVQHALNDIDELSWDTFASDMKDEQDIYNLAPAIKSEGLRLAETVKEYFFYFLPVDFFFYITDMTNTYKNCSEAGRKEKDISVNEIIHWHGLAVAHSLCEWKTGIRRNWRRECSLPFNPGSFGQFIRRDRFEVIARYLHFVDNETLPRNDKIAKIRPVVTKLNETFGAALELGTHCSFDEGKIPSKSRYLPARTYDPLKPKKWGLKLFMLCCSSTSFCTRFEVYGCEKAGPEALIRNVRHLKNSKRIIYCDRYYTSVTCFLTLLSLGLYAVGTVMTNRKGFPNACIVENETALEKGSLTKAYLEIGGKRVRYIYFFYSLLTDVVVDVCLLVD